MIPILYEKTETAFMSNGLGRLRECIDCRVSEERNNIYECEFSYPVSAEDFDQIQIGRIIGVTHDDTDDIQPFDIVGYEKPIDGVVTFHCTHISYRQSYLTVSGTEINSLEDAFALLGTSQPDNPFNYETNKEGSTGYLGSADGIPRSVRSMLGGIEGSILDVYGGEYEWDRFTVKLHSSRGQMRDFTIRYGVNMLDYKDDTDASGCYSSCIPYWTDGTTSIIGDKQDSGEVPLSGRDQCVPLDVSTRFESQPTKEQVEDMGLAIMNSQNPCLPTQNITVSFVRLQDTPEYSMYSPLLRCSLCDTIKVVFPDYNTSGTFKIVKTVWNVLSDRYEEMELGKLSITLSEALGISNGLGGGGSENPYPIGSCYTTSTNTNPSTWLGGEWELIDKRFAQASGTNGLTWNNTNTRDGSSADRTFDWVREDHIIWLRLRWYNKVAFTDDEKPIATIDMATLGIVSAGYYQWWIGSSDGINGVILGNITWSGTTVTVASHDAVTRATSIPTTTNSAVYVTIPVHCNLNHMSDSACDQFIWKRTA